MLVAVSVEYVVTSIKKPFHVFAIFKIFRKYM